VLVKEILDFYNISQGDNKKENRFFIRKFHGTLTKNKKYGGMNETSNARTPEDGDALSGSKVGETNTYYRAIQNNLPPIGWDKSNIGQIKKPDPMDHLALSDECLKSIQEIKRWRNSEEWYKEKQIPHKKGILLYGKPGCGKSSVAKALAMDLNMPIMIFDLSNMSNSDFQENWDRIKNNTPCMVLLEDIDAIFDGRKNVIHEEGGLSFDCLLNCIDGVENSDGILIVATTNNIDKIDAALGKPNGDGISTRPGKIDRALELLPPDDAGRRKIAKRILGDFPNHIESTVIDGGHDTGAQFQERCSRLALKLFWENKEK
jgi:SpoVK/Ycf46/Vps4 family AAA+-type ATPase